jgi:hypothetical protein
MMDNPAREADWIKPGWRGAMWKTTPHFEVEVMVGGKVSCKKRSLDVLPFTPIWPPSIQWSSTPINRMSFRRENRASENV